MTINFRSFGGYPSVFGGTLGAGRLFRGGAPFEASLLETHNFRTIVDFRHPDEAKVMWEHPWTSRVVNDDARIGEAPHLAIISQPSLNSVTIDAYYEGIYTNFPFEDRYRRLFGIGLRSLADHDGKEAALVCCSAGKDRTGMFVALFGSVLGIDRNTILADFLKSDQDQTLLSLISIVKENVRAASEQDIDDTIAKQMLGVKPAYLDAFYSALDRRCGGVGGYLDLIGVDDIVVQRLRQNWL